MTVASRHLLPCERSLAPLTQWSPDVLDWGVFRVAGGKVSLDYEGTTQELVAGDVVVVPSGATGHFQGAGTGVARLQYFLISLQSLTGVLTLTERRLLEEMARTGRVLRVEHLTDPDGFAAEFVRICAQPDLRGSTPVIRCELLRLFANIFSEKPAQSQWSPFDSLGAQQRVERILENIPESVILSQTGADLARECGCSERHFSRLFRQRCGVSLRARQIQLRLEKAGQLLQESNAKVIQVALESGYRHLGLFNTMFKRSYGMTPSQWRARSDNPSRVSALIIDRKNFETKVDNARRRFKTTTR